MTQQNIFKIFKIFIFSFLFSFIVVYSLNHFGKISFLYENVSQPNTDGKMKFVENISSDTKISTFYFETFFKNQVTLDGEDWKGSDLKYESEFQNYENKFKFYLKGTLADKKYIFLIGLSIMILASIIVYFKEIKTFFFNFKNANNKTHLSYLGIIGLLTFLFISNYIDKLNYVDYNVDLKAQIEEINNKISELEDENKELKDKISSNEYDLQKNELDKKLYESYYNTPNSDDLYTHKQSVPYNLIEGTEFEQYITSRNSNNAELEIKGKDNVVQFLNRISRQYMLMYLSCSNR